MRAIILTLVVLGCPLLGCREPKAPAPPATGVCHDGAMLGGEEIPCTTACVRRDDAPKCVALAEATQKETCGVVSCGDGCSCASDAPNACICPRLGPPAK